MHELSLAIEAIELACREAERHQAASVSEIRLEVGELSGVDQEAFRFAMEMSVRGTLLETAVIVFDLVPGTGRCHACDQEFIMHRRLDACPSCNAVPFDVRGGQDIRVTSLITD